MLSYTPRDIILEIASHLEYMDIISLGMASKGMASLFLVDEYWQKKQPPNRRPPRDNYLTWRGKYVASLVDEGHLFPGAENFKPLYKCILEAYKKGDTLLFYFIRLAREKPNISPFEYYDRGRWIPLVTHYIMQLFKEALFDSREETFLLLLKEGNYFREIEDPVPYYLLARRKGLNRAKEEITHYFSSSRILADYSFYIVQAQDEEFLRLILPYLEKEDMERLRLLLRDYTWPQGEKLVPPGEVATHISTYYEEISMSDTFLRRGISKSRKLRAFPKMLLSGKKEEVRDILLRKDLNLVDDIRGNFKCNQTSTKELYDSFFSFTVPVYKKPGYDPPLLLGEIQEDERMFRDYSIFHCSPY